MTAERLPAPDGVLVARAAGGDRGAFETLYARHAPRIMAFAHHLLADHAAAEDVTQETFVKLWRHARGFRAGAPFEPWLYRIARNEAFDAHTRLRRGAGGARLVSLDALDALDPRLADGPGRPAGNSAMTASVTASSDGELAARLRDAVPALSAPLREAFVLVRLMGRSQDEAALLLDVPAGTVKSRVAAAEIALRARLGSP